MIDIHCHILAEVDDGPKSWDVAEEMCRMAVADGIEHIVATPHANDRYKYDRDYLTRVLDISGNALATLPALAWAATSICRTRICRMSCCFPIATPLKAAVICWSS